MTTYIEEFENYKQKIPEFIVKLYHILESKEYSDFICWHGDGQVLIRSGKKLQDKVLPHFFRHRHLSSFIRQLNMYKFSKVNKLTKEKNHMYFRNDYFRRGQIKQMIKIKRNNKKSKKQFSEEALDVQEEVEQPVADSEISINKQLDNNIALENYKQYVKATVRQISENIKKFESGLSENKQEISTALTLCNQLLQTHQLIHYPQINSLDESLQNKNMLSTMRLLPPRLDSIIFPSQYSFCQF